MQATITVKNEEALDCHENLIAAYAAAAGRDYEMMLTHTWGFRFDPAGPDAPHLVGPRFNAQRNPDYEQLLHYHGLELEINDTLTSGQIYRIVQEEHHRNRPVAVGMDAFWCPWYKAPYQKMHFMHYTFITRIDRDNGNLYGINIMAGIEPVLLPYDHFEQGCRELTLFRTVASTRQRYDWELLLREAAERLLDNGRPLGAFGEMRQFAASLVTADMKSEVQGYTPLPLIAPLIYQMRETFRGRKQFAMVLQYMNRSVQSTKLDETAAALMGLYARWRTVFDLLSKAYFSSSPAEIMAHISAVVNGLADDEEKLAESIIQV